MKNHWNGFWLFILNVTKRLPSLYCEVIWPWSRIFSSPKASTNVTYCCWIISALFLFGQFHSCNSQKFFSYIYESFNKIIRRIFPAINFHTIIIGLSRYVWLSGPTMIKAYSQGTQCAISIWYEWVLEGSVLLSGTIRDSKSAYIMNGTGACKCVPLKSSKFLPSCAIFTTCSICFLQ